MLVSQAPFLVGLWRCCFYCPPISSFYISSSNSSLLFLSFLAPAMVLHTHAQWPKYSRLVTPSRYSTSFPQDALEVLCELSTDSQGSGIPKIPRLMLWPRILQKLASTSSPTNIAGKKVSLREYSIVTIIVTTTGTVLCRYCQSRWSDTPKPLYSNWVWCLDILGKVRTPWDHASTWGSTHSSNSYLGPR